MDYQKNLKGLAKEAKLINPIFNLFKLKTVNN